MFSQFLNFVLQCWKMLISIFESTKLGGFSYMAALVAIFILTLITRVVFIVMK